MCTPYCFKKCVRSLRHPDAEVVTLLDRYQSCGNHAKRPLSQHVEPGTPPRLGKYSCSMSASTPIAAEARTCLVVCFLPESDIARLFDHLVGTRGGKYILNSSRCSRTRSDGHLVWSFNPEIVPIFFSRATSCGPSTFTKKDRVKTSTRTSPWPER